MQLKLDPNANLKPTMPPCAVEGYVGSVILLDLLKIPAEIGNVTVTGVRVAATYPDNSTATVDCTKETDGTWSCTLPATPTSGRVANGVQFLVDGKTPSGDVVTGYVLAITELAVYTRDMTVDSSGTSWIFHYFDTQPATPKKCDAAPIDGALKYYNGAEWVPFTDLSDYYTAEQVDEAIDKLAAYYITYNAAGAAFPTRAALVNASTYYSGGVARTPTRNDYAVVLADETHDGAEWRYIYAVADGETTGQWEAQYPIETNDYDALAHKPQINGVSLSGNKTAAQLGLASTADATLTERYGSTETAQWTITYPQGWAHGTVYITWFDEFSPIGWVADCDGDRFGPFSDNPNATTLTGEVFGETITATRTALPGYQLGEQSDKPLASEAEAEALRTAVGAKANKPSTATSGNLAKFDENKNPVDSGVAANAVLTAHQQLNNNNSALQWRISVSSGALDGLTIEWDSSGKKWILEHDGAMACYDGLGNAESLSLQWLAADNTLGVDVTATRQMAGWVLGTQSDKPLATAEQGAKAETAVQPSGIAMKANDSAIAPEFDASASYAVGAVVMHEGARFKCTTAHSGAWAAADFTAESVQEAMDAGGGEVKPTRIYNSAGTDALDDKGQLFKSSISVGYWATYKSSTGELYRNLYFTGVTNGIYRWDYSGGTYYVTYNANNGEIRVYPDVKIATVASDLDPLSPDCIFPDCHSSTAVYKYTPSTVEIETTPYARFAIEAMPTAWAASTTYTVGVCASSGGKAYRCKTEHTSGSTFDASKWDEIPVLSQKANAADLPYSFNAATVGSGTTPTVTNLANRAINYATLGSTVTAATITLPAAVSGRSRDFYVDLTIEAADAPTLTFIDPATSTTATPAFGKDSLADIAPGYNLVLWTELPNNRWLVSVKHEEAAS